MILITMPRVTEPEYQIGDRIMYEDPELWYLGAATVIRSRPTDDRVPPGHDAAEFVLIVWDRLPDVPDMEDKFSIMRLDEARA